MSRPPLPARSRDTQMQPRIGVQPREDAHQSEAPLSRRPQAIQMSPGLSLASEENQAGSVCWIWGRVRKEHASRGRYGAIFQEITWTSRRASGARQGGKEGIGERDEEALPTRSPSLSAFNRNLACSGEDIGIGKVHLLLNTVCMRNNTR